MGACGQAHRPSDWVTSMAHVILRSAIAICAGLFAAASPAGAQEADHEISTKPPASAQNRLSTPATSSIGLKAAVSYQALSESLSSAIPQTFDASGRQKVCADLNEAVQHTVQKKIGGDVGKMLGHIAKIVTQVVTVNQVRHVCQDVDYHVDVARTSPVTVSSGGDKVHVETEVSITGWAGFSGDVAKALGLNKKNFRGGIRASTDLSLDVDEHWCPRLRATTAYAWTSRGELEIVHNVWLGIEGQVGDKVKNQLDAAVAKLQAAMTCASVTDVARNAWHPYSFPFAIQSMQPSMGYASFIPTGVGFSGLDYGGGGLALALSLRGTLGVSSSPPSAGPPGDFPPLARIPGSTDDISLKVPVTIRYADASVALQRFFDGKTFEADTIAGHTKIMVSEVRIYPSAGKLAVALKIAASSEREMLATSGTVYLLATPVLDDASQTLSVKDVTVTAVLDNALWSMLATIFNGQIASFIQTRAYYDLEPRIEELKDKLQSQLPQAAAAQHVELTFEQGRAALGGFSLGEDAMEVTAAIAGRADAVVQQIAIPPIH